MALIGLKKSANKLNFKSKSAGPWGEGKPEVDGGVCPVCGEYDVEVDAGGYCRDADCRRERVIKALHDGEAMMMPTGVLIWTPGYKIRADK